jgi:hypothetical protein
LRPPLAFRVGIITRRNDNWMCFDGGYFSLKVSVDRSKSFGPWTTFWNGVMRPKNEIGPVNEKFERGVSDGNLALWSVSEGNVALWSVSDANVAVLSVCHVSLALWRAFHADLAVWSASDANLAVWNVSDGNVILWSG